MLRSRCATSERGAALVMIVLCLAVILGGLSYGLMQENRGATIDVGRSDGQIRALELAEIGLTKAELEIASLVDPDADGVGNITRSYAGGTYTVTSTHTGT